MKKEINEETKEFLVKKFTEQWLEDNKEFFDDYAEICQKIMELRLFYGVEIGIMLKNSEEVKGRELGKGFTD